MTTKQFANIFTHFASESQSLCGSAPGDEESLITLALSVTKYLSLPALVDCLVSNNFVRRKSLEGLSLS